MEQKLPMIGQLKKDLLYYDLNNIVNYNTF